MRLAMVALAAAACGPPSAMARVGPIYNAVPAERPLPVGNVEVDRERSRIEVIGADMITGEHVALIREPEVRIATASGVLRELVVVADLQTLRVPDDAEVEDFVRSPEYLDVDRFPRAEFRSLRVRPLDEDGRYRVSGWLALHGVTRVIEFDARLATGPNGARLDAAFLLPRHAFDIRRRDRWDFLIAYDLRVRLRVVAKSPP